MKLFRRRGPELERIAGITVLLPTQHPHPDEYPPGSIYKRWRPEGDEEWVVVEHRYGASTAIHPQFQSEYGASAPYVELWGVKRD